MKSLVALAACVSLSLVTSGCGDDAPSAVQPEPPIGATSFVSAAFGPGGPDARATDFAQPTEGGTGERTVEEGDIYRLMADGRVLNLNPYRGLQVIDVSQLDAPQIVGRARLVGDPVELYVVDDHAIVLLNRWRGYYGGPSVEGVEPFEGGAALVVDLSDPSAPRVVDRVPVGDRIVRSRLTRQGDHVALYVAAELWLDADGGGGVTTGVALPGGATLSESPTLVKSFQLVGAKLEARGERALGGYVSAIQATPEALLVARFDWQAAKAESHVAVVDISDSTGVLGATGEVTVPGYVQSQFNMDLYRGVLRVVSGAGGDAGSSNQVATFDATDLTTMAPLDTCAFGAGESLFATLFLGSKAFFVTYERVDPFHAFEVTDEGQCLPHAEYVVSGWNDFFKPAVHETRLLGVGVNDEAGSRNVAVSLYNIVDLDNPTPMVARAEVDLDGSWSEASWEHRAFTVLDDAVSAMGPHGEVETGLVLVPFSGWNDADGYLSGVQILTYSADSLTARGVLHHDAPVRRSFPVAAATTAALSDLALQLYDTSDLDLPTAGGRVELAPEYGQVQVFGDHAARVVGGNGYAWYRGNESELPDWSLEIVSLDGDPDLAPALATVAIPRGATIQKVNDHLLAVMVSSWQEASAATFQMVARVDLYDLSAPLTPTLAGSVDGIPLGTGGYGYGYGYGYASGAPECMGCGGRYAAVLAWVVGDALVFSEAASQSDVAGTYLSCETRPLGQDGGGGTSEPDAFESDAGGPGPQRDDDGSYLTGRISCTSYDGGPEQCWGAIWQCPNDGSECQEIEPTIDQVVTECSTHPYDRYWQSFTLHVLDVSDPTAPALSAPLALPIADAGVGFVVDGTSLYYSYYRPTAVDGDAKPYVRYYVRAVDLSVPRAPVSGVEVNVPGRLLVVDGTNAFTQDYVYAAGIIESAVSRLDLSGSVATLQARHRFEGRAVQHVALDGAGHVLVTHGVEQMWMDWYAYDMAMDGFGTYGGGYYGGYEGALELSMLDVSTLSEQATVEVAGWATLHEAVAGRAVFEVPGGVLVFTTQGDSGPTPQAYFPTQGWPRELLVEGNDILFAAGRYGLYRFGLNEKNLLVPQE